MEDPPNDLRHARVPRYVPYLNTHFSALSGEFTTFDFIPGIPAPFNFFLAILTNRKMLSLAEKLQSAPALIPMLLEGQPFIDAQDELSCTQFMRKYGMPEKINTEVRGESLEFVTVTFEGVHRHGQGT